MQQSGVFTGFGQSQQSKGPQLTSSLFGTPSQPTQNQQQGGIFGGLSSDQNNQSSQIGLNNFPSLGQSNQFQQASNSTLGQSQVQLQPLLQLGRSGIWQPNSSISPRSFSSLAAISSLT